MSSTTASYLRGMRDSAPMALVVVPFGLLFGVVGTEAGLNLAEVMGFSILVIAGASQFTALQMLQEQAPTLVVLLTALAVNLRMAMYSVALAPHLGGAPVWQRALAAYFLVDQTFAVSAAAYERKPSQPLAQKVAYYFGAVTPICPPWYLASWAGATLGQAIPPEFALDFAVPITFLAMIAPALRSLPHVVAAGVSIAVALGLAGLPYSLGLLVASVVAMVAGAQTERWMMARRGAAMAGARDGD